MRWAQNTPDAADFASSAVLAFANAIPGGVAFNFALRRLTSETTVASARSLATTRSGAGYVDLPATSNLASAMIQSFQTAVTAGVENDRGS